MEIIVSILLLIFFWKSKDIANFLNSLFFKSNTEEKSQTIQSETENTISDIKNETINLVTENDTILIPSETATTDFQDELKATTRTKEEIEKENNNTKNNKIIKDANETFERIKSEILRSGKNGDYTIISEKKVITATVYMPAGYHIHNEVPATFEKVRNSFFNSPQPSLSISEISDSIEAASRLNLYKTNQYHLVLKTHRKTVFEPISDSEYKLFWKELKRLTAAENITISPIILDEMNNKEYAFPCSIEEDIRWDEYSCLIKCICTVPEQYSSDIPITAIYNDNSNSDLLDSDEKHNLISIDDMDGHRFENFCAELLTKNGFKEVDVTKGSGDQGIDIIAYKDGVKYGIQCKCYTADIGNKAVQEAFSGKAYYKCHVGVVLTNRYFTRSAIELSNSNGILLWDRSYLIDLMKKSGFAFDESK